MRFGFGTFGRFERSELPVLESCSSWVRPRSAAKTSTGQVEDQLSKLAETSSVDVFAEQSRRWVNRNQPDDGSELYQQQRQRRLLKHWTNDEGMGVLLAELDPTSYQQVLKAINVEYDRLWRDDGGRDGTPNEIRTPTQRLADAFVALLTDPARRGPGSARMQLIAVADIERLRADNPTRVAEIIGGEALPQTVLERLMCTAAVTGVVFDGKGQPIWWDATIDTPPRLKSKRSSPVTGTAEAALLVPNDARYITSCPGNKAGSPTSTPCVSPAHTAITTSTTVATSSSKPTPATKSSTPTTHRADPNCQFA